MIAVDSLLAFFLPRAGLAGPWRLDWLFSHARVYATRNLVAGVFWLLPYEFCQYLVQPVWAGLCLLLAAVHAVVFGVMLGVLSSRGTGGGG